MTARPRRHALALGCALALGLAPLSAAAQQMAPGLPLVLTKDGWARYRMDDNEGPLTVVIRVGARDRRRGRQGTWIKVEVGVPEAGRMAVEYLVAGAVLDPQRVLAVRATVPGQPPKEEPPSEDDEPVPFPPPKALGKKQAQLGKRTLQVTTYELGTGLVVDWSARVPGFGFVRVLGESPMILEDFGVGGDPWRGIPVDAPAAVVPPASQDKPPQP